MHLRTVVIVVLALLSIAVPDQRAGAAVEIAASTPVSGATLTQLPEMVEVWSAEPADPAFAQVIVVAPNGARIDAGAPEFDVADPTHMVVGVASDGVAGHYTVHLVDGEPNTARERSASFSFDVTGDTACEGDGPGVGCAEAPPEVELGEDLMLPEGHAIAVSVSSDVAGPVNIEVNLRDHDGNAVESARVWVRALHLDMDHGEFPHAAILNDEGVYVANYIGMGMEGTWRLAVDVILEEGTPFTVAVPVEMKLPGS